ncbi:unnamed protein product, partial [marine sediment metagenome]
NLDYIQPIPIAYFRHDNSYLLLRRSEESRKDRMHDKYVLWAGGHVRQQDARNGNPIKKCLLREVSEELYIKELPEPILTGLMLDTSSIPSSCHLAVVHQFSIDHSDVAISLDNKEFKERKGKSVSGSFILERDVENYFDKMEFWSKLLIVKHLKILDRPISQQAILF